MNKTSVKFPEVKHTYQNHIIDSTRWNAFPYRDGDIIISTAYKAGTTWMQTIVGNLIYEGNDTPAPILEISPWLDMRLFPFDEIIGVLDAQKKRRFMKTHLPLDGLPYREDVRYIFIARNPLDVFMSLWNHHSNHTNKFFEMINSLPGRIGDPLPTCPDDIHEFWHDWVSKGWFEWEHDGYPYWSFFHHAQTWWDYRHLPNIHFTHYNDLLADLETGMKDVAAFLGINISDDLWPELVYNATFDTVKENPNKVVSDRATEIFKNGANSFIHKGTNGRWRGVLTDAELSLYSQLKSRAVTSDCAAWLKTGGPI